MISITQNNDHYTRMIRMINSHWIWSDHISTLISRAKWIMISLAEGAWAARKGSEGVLLFYADGADEGCWWCWSGEEVHVDARIEKASISADARSPSVPMPTRGRGGLIMLMPEVVQSGHQAVNYANTRQISDFYGVSNILEISTPVPRLIDSFTY